MKLKMLLPLLLLTLNFNAGAQQVEYNDVLLQKIRTAAQSLPGEKVLEVRYIRFAESPRTFSATLAGGDSTPYVQARTAYQLVYANSSVMIDAGMDEQVHHFFGKGKVEPYFSSANDTIQKALVKASKILITHEHGDHIAGVLRTKNYKALAPKTILTYQQVNTLLHAPQMPELAIDRIRVKDFITVDFYDILPVAPGVVLIKAPGHTPGEIMIYAQCENGKEYLFSGDVSWSYAGINEKKQKPKDQIKRIGEDPVQIQFELNWLNTLSDKGIQVIVSHDDLIQPQLVKSGILKAGLKL